MMGLFNMIRRFYPSNKTLMRMGAAVCLAASVSFQPATAATSMASLQNKLNKLSQSIKLHERPTRPAATAGARP